MRRLAQKHKLNNKKRDIPEENIVKSLAAETMLRFRKSQA